MSFVPVAMHWGAAPALGRGILASRRRPGAAAAPLHLVVVFVLIFGDGGIFERDFFAGLEAADDLDARVVGEAGDDDALVEELLPRVLVFFLRAVRFFLLRVLGEGLRIDRLLHVYAFLIVALEDGFDGDGEQ